jgi:protein disulfide-isomerase/protein disulfide-isomerase A1
MLARSVFAASLSATAVFAETGANGEVELTGEVAVLTKSNFDDYLKDWATGALVEFYAPWCGHCKKLEPEYNAAAKQLKEDNIKAGLGKVDATVEGDLASRFGVQGYPTLKWFVGGKDTEYDGPRDAKGIVKWLKDMTGPALIRDTPNEKDALQVIVYDKEEPEWLEGLAKTNRKKGAWYYQEGEPKVVVKHLGEDAIEKEGAVTKEDVETFFKDNGFPLYGGLDGETFSTYIERGIGMIWTLYEMKGGNAKEVVEGVRPFWTEIGKELAGKYSVTWTNTEEFGKVLENMFGITEFPRMVVQTTAGDKKKWVYDGPMDDKEALLEYLKKIENKEIEPDLKSEPVPESNDEPVKTVVGKNFNELVFDEKRDVLLEVYAPWCGHCKKLEPEYVKVGKKVIKEKMEDMLTIAKMDGTANDSPADDFTWSGFPTIFYVKAGDKKPSKFDGGRDAKSIWKWLKKNHSQADKVKDLLAANKADKDGAKEEL